MCVHLSTFGPWISAVLLVGTILGMSACSRTPQSDSSGTTALGGVSNADATPQDVAFVPDGSSNAAARVCTNTSDGVAESPDRDSCVSLPRINSAVDALRADVQACYTPGGPTGIAHAVLTFEPRTGAVIAVKSQTPYAGTSVGSCVEALLRTIQIPPFQGGNYRFGARFEVTEPRPLDGGGAPRPDDASSVIVAPPPASNHPG
jgi:hypothetical protein